MLKIIGIGVAVLIAGLFIAVAIQPSTYTVERSAVIVAPPDVVYAQLSDFHKWSAWSPWEKLDPALKRTFDGAPAGQGAIYSWVGNDKVGEGRMTIMNVKPNEQVDIKLEFIKPFEAITQTLFTLKPTGDTTQLTWTMNGTNGLMGKAISLFTDLDKAVGADFERGLASLKTVSEGEAKQRAAEDAQKAAQKAAEEAANKPAPAAPAAPAPVK